MASSHRAFAFTLLGCALSAFGAPATLAVTLFPNPTNEAGTFGTMTLADFNGDHRLDAVVGDSLLPANLRIALGAGDGTFGTAATFQTGVRVQRVATGDFDRDGRLDLTALAFDSTFGQVSNIRIEIFRGHGDGTFAAPTITSIVSGTSFYNPMDLAVGDLDGDGDPDVVAVIENQMCRLFNPGTGILNAPLCSSVGGGRVLTLADFNGDGTADIAIGANTGLSVLLTNAAGNIIATTDVATNVSIFGVASADLNRDGHPDLVYLPFPALPPVQNSRVGVAFGNGGGGFSSPILYPGYSCCGALALGDVDNDGFVDVITTGSPSAQTLGGITVIPALGGGTLGPPRTLALGGSFGSGVGGFGSAIALGDVDGDGITDMAVGVSGGGLRAYLGTPDGRFGMSSLGSGAGSDVASADLNGDGHQDLVVVEQANNRISVFLGQGDGTFASPVSYPCAGFPMGLVLGDFNGDGRLDAVTGLSGSLALLPGNGDGTFGAPVSVPGGGRHTRVVAADFTGDGKLDLASNNEDSVYVSIFWGIGNGTFEMGLFPAGIHPHALAVGDVDGDHVLDLVVGTVPYSGGPFPNPLPPQGLGILHGVGDGTFAVPQFLTWSQFSITISDLFIGDLNGDGIIDLAASENDLSLFFGQGLGTFAPRTSLTGTSPTAALAAADVDGDGRIDLVAGSASSADLSVFLANGGGGFLPVARFGTQTPADLVAGDFNEDGVIDFALATPDGTASAVFRPGSVGPGNAPVADAGPDRTAECGPILLDGSASSDADSTPGTNDDIVQYSWFENYGLPSQVSLGTGPTLAVSLGVGAHTVTLKVTDTTGRTDTDEVLITLSDTLPPSGTVVLSPGTLWPPNHRMVDVTAQVLASDQCGGPVTVTLDSVTSSEPDDAPGGADGSTTGDIAGVSPGTPDFQFSLRAERSSTGPGRIYTVSYRLADNLGHQTIVSAPVTVPHDITGVTDPITLTVSIAAGGDALVEWNAVAGATRFDVVAGLLSTLVNLDPSAGEFSPVCMADQVPPWMTSFQIGGNPEPGTAYFFLVDYVSFADATDGRSGYGSESGPFDLQSVVPAELCP
jgi:hypothetical protein